MDQWGNYYDINYNSDGQGDALATGIRVTEIVYTMNSQNGFIAPRRIFFAYEPQERPDVRRLRFGKFTLPRNRRLSSITTPQGTYSLAYKPDDDLLLPKPAREHQLLRFREPARVHAGASVLRPAAGVRFGKGAATAGWNKSEPRRPYRRDMTIRSSPGSSRISMRWSA